MGEKGPTHHSESNEVSKRAGVYVHTRAEGVSKRGDGVGFWPDTHGHKVGVDTREKKKESHLFHYYSTSSCLVKTSYNKIMGIVSTVLQLRVNIKVLYISVSIILLYTWYTYNTYILYC